MSRYARCGDQRWLRLLMLCAGCAIGGIARAADWPQWRGTSGQGHVGEDSPPPKWDAKTGLNVAWKSPLPKTETPYSSPALVGGKVFITLANARTREHIVLCYDAADGKELWKTPIEPGPWRLDDLRGGYAAPTPAADDRRVYAFFGSAVLVALDHSGKIVWRHELERYAFDVAIGGSPLLYKDTLILQADMLKRQSSLVAFDRATGKKKWEEMRPTVGFAHATPTLIEVSGKPLLLVAASDALQGVDPQSGKVLWFAKAKGDTVSPVYSPDAKLAYIDSGRGGAGYAIRIEEGMSGDVTKTHTAWTIPQMPEAFGSPVIVGEHLYRLHSPGILKCINLADGKVLYSERLEGAAAAVSPIVTGDGKIFFASSGRSFVVKAKPTFELLATNELKDGNFSSPAVSGKALFLKGREFLWCIRETQ